MKKPFKVDYIDGDEHVMVVEISEVRFNFKTREIFVVTQDNQKFTEKYLSGLSWQSVKNLVIENGGTWKDTKAGNEFLLGL